MQRKPRPVGSLPSSACPVAAGTCHIHNVEWPPEAPGQLQYQASHQSDLAYFIVSRSAQPQLVSLTSSASHQFSHLRRTTKPVCNPVLATPSPRDRCRPQTLERHPRLSSIPTAGALLPHARAESLSKMPRYVVHYMCTYFDLYNLIYVTCRPAPKLVVRPKRPCTWTTCWPPS